MLVSSDVPFKFLPYQLSMVVYWTTMAVTGNEEFGFELRVRRGVWGKSLVNCPLLSGSSSSC